VGAEAYFAILDDGPRRRVDEYVRRLTKAGYPCREQPDEYGHWVVFDGRESTLNFSVEDGVAVFATFDMYMDGDPPEFFSAVERVFAEAGWSTGEEG
jgi:hypothetical protein